MKDIKETILAYQDEVVRLRRQIHQNPELGFEEYETAALVEEYLADCGIETKRMTQTGVVGLLHGEHPGPTVLLRADMDALPVQEETGLPFASTKPQVMHACGHDGHVAMLLVAARILSGMKDELHGTVKFCFQPNEEDAGAEPMIKDGVLENPHVDYCAGVHLWQPIPLGKIGLKEGAVMAGMDSFKLVIHGVGGHSGEPHKAVDPITAACAIVSNVDFVEKRQIGALNPTVLTINSFHAGTACNVICDEVVMEGSLRYLYDGGDESEQRPRVRFEELVKHICAVYGTSYELSYKPSNSTLINDANVVNHLRPIAEEMVGSENVIPYVCMMGEDFAEFTREVPGAFVFIGTGNDTNACYAHHHPKFDIDEAALTTGIEFHVRTALSYLS